MSHQHPLLDAVEREHMKKKVPEFQVGDTVDVHVAIKEGDKERIQVFSGIVIARKGSGTRESFTVRRIVQGEGVERSFPLHSMFVKDIIVRRAGKVRRARLFYLRKRVGKSAKVEENIAAARVVRKGGGAEQKKAAEEGAAAPAAGEQKAAAEKQA